MADLFSILKQSGNSLSAHSAALATAGHNVANVNTPGYARQIANLAANPALTAFGVLGMGTGVSLQSITQARDQFVERQMPNALAAQARSDSESTALGAVTALDPDMPGGLTSALGAFYSSLRTLSQNPGDMAVRQAVIGDSRALARSFNQTVGSIEDARTGLDAGITGQLSEINSAASAIVDLNRRIQLGKATGGRPNDLIDRRQAAMDTLARLTGATPYTNGAGDVSMALPGGTALVTDGGAAQLLTVPDPANGGHTMFRLIRADGTGPIDLAASAVGGALGGMLAARDGALRTAVDTLDTFAFDLATAVNTIHRGGYALDGTTGRDLFTVPLAASGAASALMVNGAIAADPRLFAAATTAPVASGDNRNVLALIATEQQALAGGNNPIVSFQQIVAGFGTATAQSRALADHDQAMAAHITGLRDATSGVSLDEEMINLTKAQKAYEAVAKVVATADLMLDTLMKLR